MWFSSTKFSLWFLLPPFILPDCNTGHHHLLSLSEAGRRSKLAELSWRFSAHFNNNKFDVLVRFLVQSECKSPEVDMNGATRGRCSATTGGKTHYS